MSEEKHPAEAEFESITATLPPAPIEFDPERIYYSPGSTQYFVDAGKFYRGYKRKEPVKTGVRRYFETLETPADDIDKLIGHHMENIELDRAIDWDGKLAGHLRGELMFSGRRFLITEGYKIPDAKDGDCPLHMSVITQAFPQEDALITYCGWLKGGVNAIRAGCHVPAPMLVLAGVKGAGKSLLGHIGKMTLGGRSANPMTAWTGILPWSDNLLGAELLLIDDSVASTDPRARKAFGARFKEGIYAGDVEINTRNKSSISIRPVWRVMICCNETPENLSVIPPLEDGIEDKIILLKVSPVNTPMPAKEPEEKKAFRAALKAELPAFLRFLENLEIPEHISDSRSGITAWKDAELLKSVLDISPEKQMENLIVLSMSKGHLTFYDEGEEWKSAAEIQEILQERDSPTAHQARELLKFHLNAGRYLSALVKQKSPYVTDRKQIRGITNYKLERQVKE